MKAEAKKWGGIIFMALLTTTLARAEEKTLPAMPRPIFELRKHGTVSVTKDKSGEVTSIKLIVTSYEITLDENSKPLEVMDGQKVRVLGTYKKIDDEGWLRVSDIEPISDESKKITPVEPKPDAEKTELAQEQPAKPSGEKSEEKPKE